MTKDEALRLALEALEADELAMIQDKDGHMVYLKDQAITAIKAALEAKDEPHGWKLVPIEPTDEMLKAMDECSTEGYDERLYAGYAASVYMAAVDVAPTPPQRTWIELTEDEIVLISADCAATHQHTDIHFARAIEAKLKEKNT